MTWVKGRTTLLKTGVPMLLSRSTDYQQTLSCWWREQFSRFGGESMPSMGAQSRPLEDGEFEATLPDQQAPKKLRIIDTSEGRLLYTLQFEMLKAIGNLQGKSHPPVWHKIVAARDLDFLWNLRVELMEVLAKSQGEAVARQLLDEISKRFRLKP
jgi:hypothetical protein